MIEEKNDNLQEFERNTKKMIESIDKLIYYLEKMHLAEYINLLQNPKRLIIINFIAGLSRGFGWAIGMTFLFTLFGLLLHALIGIPVIGDYIRRLIK